MVQRLAVVGIVLAAVVAVFAFVQQQEAMQRAADAQAAQADADVRRSTAVSLAQEAIGTQVQAEAGLATAAREAEAAASAMADAQANATALAADAQLAGTAVTRGQATAEAQMTAAAEQVAAGESVVQTIQAQSTADSATADARRRAAATQEVILFAMLGTATAQVDLARFAAEAAEEDRATALAQSRAALTEVAGLQADLATAQFQLTGLPPAPTAPPATPTPPPTDAPEPTPRPGGETALSQQFESQDGSIAFDYPADWFAVEFSGGGISMTNDRQLLQTESTALSAEQVYVDLFTLTGNQMGGIPAGTPVTAIAGTLITNITSQPNSTFRFDAPTTVTLNAHPGARAEGSSGSNALVLFVLDVGSDTYVIAAASSAPGALSTHEPVLRAILESLVFTA